MSMLCVTILRRKAMMILIISASSVGLLSGCGNKGELFLVNDAVSVEDLQILQQELGAQDVPVANPTEVEDGAVFIDLDSETKGKPADKKPALLPE